MFSGVAEHICTLTPGTSALILDVRAFAQSALMGKSFLQVAVELAGEVRYLQPISVMGNWGFGPEVESHVQGQEVLGSIKDALMGWQEVGRCVSIPLFCCPSRKRNETETNYKLFLGLYWRRVQT